MVDMLIKLYEIEDDWRFLAKQQTLGITLRKPIGPEKHGIIAWVSDHFGAGWASETDVALSHNPGTCFVAVKDADIIGFACYDATALGFFGPIGVAESHRQKGTGTAFTVHKSTFHNQAGLSRFSCFSIVVRRIFKSASS